MAEEYRPNLNRLKNKSGDGEDPILVAQRFLNIFRQLHIFDEKRHAEFKAQILALPPEIRNAFNVLPGGQALQEYADEVVREAGGQTFAIPVPHHIDCFHFQQSFFQSPTASCPKHLWQNACAPEPSTKSSGNNTFLVQANPCAPLSNPVNRTP